MNRSSFFICFFWKCGAPLPWIRQSSRTTQMPRYISNSIYDPVWIKSVTAMIQNSIGWQQNSNKGMPKPTTTKLFPLFTLQSQIEGNALRIVRMVD